MKRLWQLRKHLYRRSIIGIICLALAGGTVGGWQAYRATDPTRVEPIAVPVDVAFHNGDIILAGGVSLQSRLVRTLTDDNTYSHVGMLEVTPQGVYVIHAAPKGPGDGGMGEQVAKIPLSLFLAERGYVAVRVMRMVGPGEAAEQAGEQACAYALACAEREIGFDNDFDLIDHSRMYCSELIYMAYKEAGMAWPDTLVGSYDNMFVEGPGVTPGAFVGCSDLQTIWQY